MVQRITFLFYFCKGIFNLFLRKEKIIDLIKHNNKKPPNRTALKFIPAPNERRLRGAFRRIRLKIYE